MVGLTPDLRQKRSPRRDSESTLILPKFIPTMQPTLVDAAPEGGDWLHEIKYDGYRTQIAIGGGEVRAYTRNGHDWTDKYPQLCEEAARLDCQSALIDGEVVVQDTRGVTDFPLLRKTITSAPWKLVFFAFDLLHLNGVDLRPAPLEERRAHLRWILEGHKGKIHISDEYDGSGPDFFGLVDKMGLEGIVSKRKGSRYFSGASRLWLKTKCWHTDTYDVVGVERDGNGVPYALLADADGYCGTAFVSLPKALREVFWRRVEELGGAKPLIKVSGKKDATWLRPGLRATVRHLKGSDKLRHATVTDVDTSI